MEDLSEKVLSIVKSSRTKDQEFITLKNKYEKSLILLEMTTRHLQIEKNRTDAATH